MDVDPGYKYIKKFRGGAQWYMMEKRTLFQVLVLYYKMKMEF